MSGGSQDGTRGAQREFEIPPGMSVILCAVFWSDLPHVSVQVRWYRRNSLVPGTDLAVNYGGCQLTAQVFGMA